MHSRLSVRERINQEVKNIEDMVKTLVESKVEDLEDRMETRMEEITAMWKQLEATQLRKMEHLEKMIRTTYEGLEKAYETINDYTMKINAWMRYGIKEDKRLEKMIAQLEAKELSAAIQQEVYDRRQKKLPSMMKLPPKKT